MPGRLSYDLMYLFGPAWEIGPRAELVELVESGRLTPDALPPGRAADLGCGTGANALFLAEHGFDVTGIDYSPTALAKARRRAESSPAGESVRWIRGDLTAQEMPGAEGPFDLLVSYGTLEDLWHVDRSLVARTAKRLCRPGGNFLLWCFSSAPRDLPRFSLRGPSRMFPLALHPGEETELFGDTFDIEPIPVLAPRPAPHTGAACFLMARR
jgi:ubiquinone/menaquinone biosynthesis C-methylase UbiE